MGTPRSASNFGKTPRGGTQNAGTSVCVPPNSSRNTRSGPSVQVSIRTFSIVRRGTRCSLVGVNHRSSSELTVRPYVGFLTIDQSSKANVTTRGTKNHWEALSANERRIMPTVASDAAMVAGLRPVCRCVNSSVAIIKLYVIDTGSHRTSALFRVTVKCSSPQDQLAEHLLRVRISVRFHRPQRCLRSYVDESSKARRLQTEE
jgi:hypothetical protein